MQVSNLYFINWSAYGLAHSCLKHVDSRYSGQQRPKATSHAFHMVFILQYLFKGKGSGHKINQFCFCFSVCVANIFNKVTYLRTKRSGPKVSLWMRKYLQLAQGHLGVLQFPLSNFSPLCCIPHFPQRFPDPQEHGEAVEGRWETSVPWAKLCLWFFLGGVWTLSCHLIPKSKAGRHWGDQRFPVRPKINVHIVSLIGKVFIILRAEHIAEFWKIIV